MAYNKIPIVPHTGGTGVANTDTNTITLGGALTTTPSYNLQITPTTGGSSVTLPTSGTLVNNLTIPWSYYFATIPTATVNNVTGNGEVVKVSFGTSYASKGGTFNFSTYTFTAPVTGVYKFSIFMAGKATGSNSIQVSFVCTAATYYVVNQQASSTGGDFFKAGSQIVKMTAGDTMYVNYSVTGKGATTAGYYGGGNTGTYLTGYYVGT